MRSSTFLFHLHTFLAFLLSDFLFFVFLLVVLILMENSFLYFLDGEPLNVRYYRLAF